MENYYEILGVDPGCTQQDIKKSFRKRAKLIHPDIVPNGRDSEKDIRLLLRAYEILSDPDRRREYDRSHRFVFGVNKFDYREFLKSRKDDLQSQSKLIFYDLLHSYEEEAIELYEFLTKTSNFRLEENMDHEDFMDCAFLLAEELEKKGEYLMAYELLKGIVLHEFQRPYFRHFFDEVILRLRLLTCIKMPGSVSTEVHLLVLKELADMDFPKKDTAFFLKKIAELYSDQGRYDYAVIYLRKGLALDRRLAGIKKLKQRIGYVD